MECEKCGCENCVQSNYTNEKEYYCPRCKDFIISSEDHFLYLKLKKNLTLEIKETFTNYFQFILKYDGNEITTTDIELPVHKVY